MSARATQSPQQGFAYLFLLFALAIIGLLLSAFGQNWSTTQQREREASLLDMGGQFSAALASYRDHSRGVANAPASLDELLDDKRFPYPVRHLRQIFRDPMTGQRDWDLQLADGRIVGVRSRSEKAPRRQSVPEYVVMPSDAVGSVTYHDWTFVALQKPTPGTDAASAPQAAPEH